MQQNYPPPPPGLIYHPGYGNDNSSHDVQMQQAPMQHSVPPQHVQKMSPHGAPQQPPGPQLPRSNADHPLLSDQFVVVRRPPPIQEVRVRCARDEKCVKENGHRGRCSLQHRPREDDMLRLVDQIRTLQEEVETVKDERDRLQTEVSTLWTKLAKACMFLSDIVRSKRLVRSTATPSAEECQRELKKFTMQCMQEEVDEKQEQFSASLAVLEASLHSMHSPEERTQRQAEIDAYKRQFEMDMSQMRSTHNTTAEANAAEIVPYMMVAQTMTATEKILNRK